MRKLVAALAALAIALFVAQPALADSPPLAAASPDASITTQATKWRTISTPEQLRHLTLKSEGFGPGYYRIANDFTLGDKNKPTRSSAMAWATISHRAIWLTGSTSRAQANGRCSSARRRS